MSKQKPRASGAGRKKAGRNHSVKSVVSRFILKDSTIHDFLTGLRAASKKKSAQSRKVTTAVFAKIVRQAVKKRQRHLATRG